MATVDKDFRVKHGLVVEGTTATVNGEDVITTGSTTDDLGEGTTNKYYSTTQAKTDAAELLTGATLTNITITGDGDGLTITAENGGITDISGFDTDDLTEGSTNLYFTNQRATDAGDGVFEGYGSVSAHSGNTTGVHGVTGDVVGTTDSQTLSNKTFSDLIYFGSGGPSSEIGSSGEELDIRGYSNLSLGSYTGDVVIEPQSGDIILNANGDAYVGSAAAGNEIVTLNNLDTYIGDATVDGSTGNTVTDRIATAVSDLVSGAPELLDTLNELAAAINDDASFASTIATSIGEKQNTLTAGTNISIVSDTISVTGLASTDISDFSTAALSATASAYEEAGAAQSAVDALDTDDIEEGSTNLYFTDTRAVDAIEAVVPNFTDVEINSLAKQVAATSSSLGSVPVTAYEFAKASYKTAKFLVKISNGTENEVTEVLLTLDSADNIAITEYAIVGTNGSRGEITADISGLNVRLRVNPVNDSTINVVGTLLV
jgi:hypothetical protein